MDSAASPAAPERFFLRRHRVVNAGAGTGKTHALLTQYLHLLCGLTVHGRPLEPRAICALTFTEKAAGEMRERLGRRLVALLRALAEGGPDAPAHAPGEAASSDPRCDAWAALSSVEPDLVRSARALGRPLPELRHLESARGQLSAAPIGTFHSFASALLRRHAVAAGLDPDFSLLDEDAARDLLEEASERVVLGALEGRYGEELGALCAQLIAEYGFRGGARAEGGLVEALCQLYFARAEEGQGAEGIAAAYAEDALLSERERLHAAFSSGLSSLRALVDLLSGKSAERAAQLVAEGEVVERIVAEADLASGLARALPLGEALGKELSRLRAPKDKNGEGLSARLRSVRTSLQRTLAEVRGLHLSACAAPLARGLEQLLGVLMDAYAAHKRAAAALDFTDLLRLCRDVLRDHESVRAAERSRYSALLVDEFQDTSPLQAELLRLLVGFHEDGASATAGLGLRRLYIVGDRKQSIYGFRGADVTAYERLCRELLALGADEETLSVSRRSRPALLACTNALFSRVFSADALSDDEDAAEAAPTASRSGAVGAVIWDPARDPLHPFRDDADAPGPLVELLTDAAPDEPSTAADAASLTPLEDVQGSAAPEDPLGREAGLIARRILTLRDGGFRYGDIVLLLRRFTHLLRYTAALKQAGIPHYVVRGRGFYQAQEVLDLAAFLTVLDDPEDRLALLTILRSPLCGLSDESLTRLHLCGRLGLLPLLAEEESGQPSPELLALPRDERQRLGRLLGLLRALIRCGDRLGPLACLQTLFDHTDYLGVLYADSDGEQRVANVLRLCERARACEASGGSLRGFVRALRRDSDPRLSELHSERDEPTAAVSSEAEDVVRVMTVHQSKGLEFPVVIVAGCASLERVDAPAIAYDRALGLGLKLLFDGERAPSLGALAVHELGKQRSLAESGRLFYVAATRARERLIFAGETRRGRRAPKNTWLAALKEELAASRPLTLDGEAHADGPLITTWRPPPREASADAPLAESAASPASWAGLSGELYAISAADRQHAEAEVERAHAAFSPERSGERKGPASPASLQLAMAADLLSCGRRFHLRHTLGLGEESPAVAPGRGEDRPGGLPIHTLAAEILDELVLLMGKEVLLAPPAAMVEHAVQAQLIRRGLDGRSLQAAELMTRLSRFIHSDRLKRELERELGVSLSSRLREIRLVPALPYEVALPAADMTLAAALRLYGVLDLVILVGEPATDVLILEYRYDYEPESGSPLEARRQALLSIVCRQALCAADGAVGLNVREDARLKIATCYLREADPRPRFREIPTRDRMRPDEPASPERLAEAKAQCRLGQTAALRLPVLPLSGCAELGCGYRFLCHPKEESEAAPQPQETRLVAS